MQRSGCLPRPLCLDQSLGNEAFVSGERTLAYFKEAEAFGFNAETKSTAVFGSVGQQEVEFSLRLVVAFAVTMTLKHDVIYPLWLLLIKRWRHKDLFI